MENFDLVRLVWLIGAMVLVLPGVIYGLRDRRAAVRNVAIWAALVAVVAVAYWLTTGVK